LVGPFKRTFHTCLAPNSQVENSTGDVIAIEQKQSEGFLTQSNLRLEKDVMSALSIWLPHRKQTEFFKFGVRDSLHNDLVREEPAASIRRLTAVCYYVWSLRNVWYHLKLFDATPDKAYVNHFSRMNFYCDSNLFRGNKSTSLATASLARLLCDLVRSLSFTQGRLGASLGCRLFVIHIMLIIWS